MARRKKAKSPRRSRYAGAFRIMPAIWAYAQLHVISTNVTGLSPWDFITAGTRFNDRTESGFLSTNTTNPNASTAVTLMELMAGVQKTSLSATSMTNLGYSKSAFGQLGMNLQANILPLIFSMVGIKVAKKVIVKMGINRSLNRLSDSAGMGSVIRA